MNGRTQKLIYELVLNFANIHQEQTMFESGNSCIRDRQRQSKISAVRTTFSVRFGDLKHKNHSYRVI